MQLRHVETRRGIRAAVREGGSGAPLVYLHGTGGLLSEEPLLDLLAKHFHVYAPVWPGYGEEPGEELLEDMLDFTLHGWDVVDALGLDRTHLVGHCMGGMIAAEMACLGPSRVERIALLAPAGLWLDEHPQADLFATTPFELPALLFADAEQGQRILTQGLDFSNDEALSDFMVGNARRLGTAGKILFPIPNRRLSKRLYRMSAELLLLWGAEDRLIPPLYAKAWAELVPHAEAVTLDGAGHMLPLEQPGAAAEALVGFFGSAGDPS